MRPGLVIAALFLSGCFGTDAAVGTKPEDRRVYAASYNNASSGDSAETPYSGDDARPPTDRERARGYTWRNGQLPAPLPPRCAPWESELAVKEGGCSRELYVIGCGEKDAAGNPTGQYRGNDCPECETLERFRQTKPEGCE